jgi:putative intracellular protease/amidase
MQKDISVLFILTSHSKLGNTGKSTGAFLSEFTHPWKVFSEYGMKIEIASIKGGAVPIDGYDPDDAINIEFISDANLLKQIEFSKKITQINDKDFNIIFLVGGHGSMWDFSDNEDLHNLLRKHYTSGGIIGAVCHGVAGIADLKMYNEKYFVDGRRVNSFTNDEEMAVGLETVVPYLLEGRLIENGAIFEKSPKFTTHVAVDERLYTGQNPQSAYYLAKKITDTFRLQQPRSWDFYGKTEVIKVDSLSIEQESTTSVDLSNSD